MVSEQKLTFEEALEALLKKRQSNTQEEICTALEQQGYEVNQSKISRLLRKIGAVKVVNEAGVVVYSLPREPAPPMLNAPLCNLIIDIDSNETMVVIFTSPGAASLVARLLDYCQAKTEILGTIAGDDTIFVAPKSIQKLQKLKIELKALLTK